MPNESSWAEMVKGIDDSRKHLPWEPSQFQATTRVNLCERRIKEREFDPVVMKYRNPDTQARLENTISERNNNLLSKTRDLTNQKFNIISHQGPPRRIDKVVQLPAKTLHEKDSNIISNLKKADHTEAPLLYDSQFYLERFPPKAVPKHLTNGNSKEFSIISNKYLPEYESKYRHEQQDLREYIANKYWQTHNYDLVKGRYCDLEKEAVFQSHLKTLEEVQGQAQASRLPPSVLYADGSAYNILSHEVLDDHHFRTATASMDRSLNRIKTTQVEKRSHQAGERDALLLDQRRLNKVAYERWGNEIDRGYNCVTNMPAKLPDPRPCRPATVWSKVHSNEPSMITSHGSYTMNNLAAAEENFNYVINPRPLTTLASAAAGGGSGRGNLSSTAKGSARDFARAATCPSGSLYDANFPQMAESTSFSSSQIDNKNDSTTVTTSSSSARASRAATSKIPALNLSQTEAPAVRYTEPVQGPGGQPIAIYPVQSAVRTGGLSSYNTANNITMASTLSGKMSGKI